MLTSLKSELRKLLTVRSTYVITLLGLLITGGLMSFYSFGLHDSASGAKNVQYIQSVVLNNANFISIFICIVALLMVTHEYRYNMITYTLSSSTSRSKVFLAKLLVIGGFAALVTAFVMVAGPLLTLLGMQIKGVDMVPQTIPYADLIWRGLFYGVGMAWFAAVIAYLVRNQVGAIVTFFIAINTVESLLGILLKDNVKYLPFTALQHVANVGAGPEGAAASLSPSTAALLSGSYLVGGLVVAWLLFVRRDAN